MTVHLSLFARVADFAPLDLEAALYERKSLVRMLGMRRTMFVVPLDVAAIMDEACTKAIAPRERRRLIKHLDRPRHHERTPSPGWTTSASAPSRPCAHAVRPPRSS